MIKVYKNRKRGRLVLKGLLYWVALLAFFGGIGWLIYTINAEIRECGGVAKCLGAAVHDFDNARRGGEGK